MLEFRFRQIYNIRNPSATLVPFPFDKLRDLGTAANAESLYHCRSFFIIDYVLIKARQPACIKIVLTYKARACEDLPFLREVPDLSGEGFKSQTSPILSFTSLYPLKHPIQALKHSINRVKHTKLNVLDRMNALNIRYTLKKIG